MAHLINIIFYIDEKESSIVFDPFNSIENLKMVISLSHNIAANSFYLKYKNNKIINDNLLLSDVIKGELVPVFFVIPKGIAQ